MDLFAFTAAFARSLELLSRADLARPEVLRRLLRAVVSPRDVCGARLRQSVQLSLRCNAAIEIPRKCRDGSAVPRYSYPLLVRLSNLYIFITQMSSLCLRVMADRNACGQEEGPRMRRRQALASNPSAWSILLLLPLILVLLCTFERSSMFLSSPFIDVDVAPIQR